MAAERNGDRDGAAAIKQHLSDNYDEAIRNGLKTPADGALNMDAFRKATPKPDRSVHHERQCRRAHGEDSAVDQGRQRSSRPHRPIPRSDQHSFASMPSLLIAN